MFLFNHVSQHRKVLNALALLSLVSTGACQKSVTPKAEAQSLSAEGGVDGTGGDIAMTSQADLEKIATLMPDLFVHGFYRANLFYKDLRAEEKREHDKAPEAYKPRPEDLKGIEVGNQIDQMFSSMSTTANSKNRPVSALLTDGSIKINLKEKCIEQDGKESDGAAAADGTICLSAARLRQIPMPQSLFEMFALVGHEISHVYGFNESDAKNFQWFMRDLAEPVALVDDLQLDFAWGVYTEPRSHLRNIRSNLADFESNKIDLPTFQKWVCGNLMEFEFSSLNLAAQSLPATKPIVVGVDIYRKLERLNRLTKDASGYCKASGFSHLVMGDNPEDFVPLHDLNRFKAKLQQIETFQTDEVLPRVREVIEAREIKNGDATTQPFNSELDAPQNAYDWKEILKAEGVVTKLPWE